MMSKNSQMQPYTNPPIKEAVFDLQIRGGKPFNENLFRGISEKTKDYIPHGFLRNINIDTKTNKQTSELVGCRYISQDKKQIVVFKKDGFSFSRLEVYNGWDKNYKEALKLWKKYCEIMNPEVVTRIATRFINQFHISHVFTKPEEYFNSYVQYDNNISRAWNHMSYRLLIPHSNGIKSHIRFDSTVNPGNQGVDILFDIDVFSDNLGFSKENVSELEGIFCNLRKIKNDIFEKSITDKIRELIK